mgnify:CR=1 FL=1
MQKQAAEKLRVIDILKENATMVLAIGGFMYMIFSYVILPIKNLDYQVNDIIGNHLKTIEDEQIIATEERRQQGDALEANNIRLTRIEVLLEQLVDTKSSMKE